MTLRLTNLAVDNWAEIDGFAASQNLPPLQEMPLARFCNFIRWYATRNADDKEKAKFEAQLWRPPPGVAPERGPWSPEAENAALASLKAGLAK